ncbi:MAG: hypothetical protein M1352_01215 [Patescibacteria group bacterium]|nr:hypothetical protein [Patescibacteria group bacterium]
MKNLIVNSYLILLFMLLVSSAAFLPNFLFRVSSPTPDVLGAKTRAVNSARIFRFTLPAALGQNTYYADLADFTNNTGRKQTFRTAVLELRPKQASFSAEAFFGPDFKLAETVLKDGQSAGLSLLFKSLSTSSATPVSKDLEATVAIFPTN